VVTVFQPSDSLRKALNKSKDGEGKEIEKLRTTEEEDPSSWVPLDPLRTFGHYPHLFMQSADDPTPSQNRQSADDPTPVKIRVLLGTEDYQLKNGRFRKFLEDESMLTSKVERQNDQDACFGHAKYVHKDDGESTEWRPVLAKRPDAAGQFPVQFIFEDGDEKKVSEDDLVLAPTTPQIWGSGHVEHQPFLAKAREMSSTMTEDEIVVQLNSQMMQEWQASAKTEDGKDQPQPPEITKRAVQAYLNKSAYEE
jgi:hypothetical protein